MSTRALELVLNYHQETKHHYHRFARSLGMLDWANQPDAFRRYEGAPLLELPFLNPEDATPYAALYRPGRVPPAEVSRERLAQLFELSLGLSAWKEYLGSRWALRVNPSSGNLHPTEGYVIAGPLPGLFDAPVVAHYAPREHGLELRADFSVTAWRQLAAGFPDGTFFVGLASIPWREAWKYGERAYRYCQHDCGHALAAMRLSAAMLGWRLVLLEDLSDADVARLLGLSRTEDFHADEAEHPDLVGAVVPDVAAAVPLSLPETAIDGVAAGTWRGRARRLSRETVPWRIIDVVAEAAAKPRTSTVLSRPDPIPLPLLEAADAGEAALPARRILMQRRSAVDYDGKTTISTEQFYRMLARTLPAHTGSPWDALPWPPRLHLGLFVHRVEGLSPGLYFLARDAAALEPVRRSMRRDFLWQSPEGRPAELPLFLLQAGDCRMLAAQVSCTQAIAGDGAFSLGMIARFLPALSESGAWNYRRLFWEAGMIGQVLYLEAEAIGVRGTGIGCYFDDAVHEVFGLADLDWQSLYHFTVGGPVEDSRLTTLPPYESARSHRLPPEQGGQGG
ncbi:SagB/ThcOx family dehydrogenase [bacterium]|nr:SagB/ThcOx family dehydrogenase [bacterium]